MHPGWSKKEGWYKKFFAPGGTKKNRKTGWAKKDTRTRWAKKHLKKQCPKSRRVAEILRNTLKIKEKAGFFTEKLQKVKIRGRFGKEKQALKREVYKMEGQVIIKPKGGFADSEEIKIIMAEAGINDIEERLKLNIQLSGDAIQRIEEKILDAIFISEIDLPLYIVALESLTEVFKEAINGTGDIKEAMEARLEMLRRAMNIGIVITTETKE